MAVKAFSQLRNGRRGFGGRAMATTEELCGAARKPEAQPPERRDEAARARAYLDLWERHVSQSAVDGPILSGFHPIA
jgi:hypothetical protein